MRARRGEFKLLMLTYLLTIAVFGNLAVLKQPLDIGAIIMGAIIFVLVTYAYFIIRRFFPDGDKFILQFAAIFSVIGIGMLYRLKPAFAIRQVIWFTLGMTMFVLIIVILPNIKKFIKYKRIYMIAALIFMALPTFFGRDISGAKNWVFIGSFGFQPSEFGKLLFVAYLAAALSAYKNFKNLIEPALVVMVTLGFMVLQRDLGSALIFFGISITMLYIATSKGKSQVQVIF